MNDNDTFVIAQAFLAREAKLLDEFPDVEILIHPDPDGLVDETGMAAHDVLPPEAAASSARE